MLGNNSRYDRTRRQHDRDLCCRSLEDVVRLIAISLVAISLVVVILTALTLTSHRQHADHFLDRLYNQSQPSNASVQEPDTTSSESESDSVTFHRSLVRPAAVSVLVAAVGGAVMSLLLLIAVCSRRKSLLLLWLIYFGVLLLVLSLVAVALVVAACVVARWPPAGVALAYLAAVVVLWSWYSAVFAYRLTLL